MAPEKAPPSAEGEKARRAHSEDYFGDSRDFWWNADFIGLMARRLNWLDRSRVLEVGCGDGHWMRTLVPFLAAGTEIHCVDRDPRWSDPGAAWAAALAGRGVKLKVQPGDATALPFADGSFDFVTCQTLLIHLSDPSLALGEMRRVLQPGGLLLCVEPDNFAGALGESSLSRTRSVQEDTAAFRFALIQQRGRIARGLGNLSLGGRLPGLFAATGFSGIQVHIGDKALPLFPPYGTEDQVAKLQDIGRWYESGMDFSRDEAQRNHRAGGGDEAEFEACWLRENANRRGFIEAVRNKIYDDAGGPLVYLVSGTKPAGG